MTYLAIPEAIGEELQADLLAAAPMEAGAFCRLHRVAYSGSSRCVLGSTIRSEEPWAAQQHDLLRPSGRRISAAVSTATSERCGLAFIHSHPGSGEPALSPLDRETTVRLGSALRELLDGPFASLVVTREGWAGASTSRQGLETTRIATVGRNIRLHPAPDVPLDSSLDDRQIRALGAPTQRLIRSLRVGIVGVGGLGSPIAETLVRIGVGEVRLVDHDELDTMSNARRVFGVARRDVETVPAQSKADVVARSLSRLELGTKVVAIVGDIRDEAIRRKLLDVDVLICGTDTHSSRAALTELAVRGSLPLIDVGVRVGIRGRDQLDALRLERRVQVPGGPCLWCWETLDAEQVRLELMPETDRMQLVRDGYVTGVVGEPAPSVAALTVTAAGAAASALVGMLSGAFDTAPLGVGIDALTLESAPLSRQFPNPTCVCSRWRKRAF